MVKKAKTQLTLALTVAVLSIVIFISIGNFITTYFSNMKLDKKDLQDIMIFYAQNDNNRDIDIRLPGFDNFLSFNDKNRNMLPNDQKLPKRQYFYIEVKDGRVINAQENMPNNFFSDNNEYKDIDLSSKEVTDYFLSFGSSGRIKYEDMHFLFDSIQTGDSITYFFLDTSLTYRFIENMLKTTALILVLTLLYILLISRIILNRALDPLELSIENQKRFTSDASHELRTPLTAIRSNLDILIDYDLSKSEQQEWISNISYEINRMTKLTNDLLAISRNDIIEKDFYNFELKEVLESIRFNYQNICEISVIGGDFNIFGVKEDFLQLIMIFVDNGIKYNSKEVKIIDITAELDKRAKKFSISIKDNGDGIENNNYEQIFERFYREDKARTGTSGGFGLGLSIARNIINEYDGIVKVSSTKNEGTIFYLSFQIWTNRKSFIMKQ